ncbi:MAG TPA: hypothetical protein VFJ16_27030 [Longimicrobium sp.]|nr:hypothetical protein [Longimicrobium sp.]
MKRTIAPAAINALREALTCVYWYKSDLRSFLQNTISDPAILARVNWEDYKRNIVATVVDYLARDQATHQGDLLRLMSEVVNIRDFSHLEKLEDGKAKAQSAKRAVAALDLLTKEHRDLEEEQKQAEARRQGKHEELLRTKGVKDKLDSLQKEFFGLLTERPQKRGYQLEKMLRDLFELFDLDPKASFRLVGEQIDGAFTFEGIDYLLEAKWQNELVSPHDLDAFSGKLTRKLENTLGLFLSINGFSEDGVRAHSTGRRLMLLMDGSDLMAVLEGRIDLVQLLLRKRRTAAQTGNIYVKIHEIL